MEKHIQLVFTEKDRELLLALKKFLGKLITNDIIDENLTTHEAELIESLYGLIPDDI